MRSFPFRPCWFLAALLALSAKQASAQKPRARDTIAQTADSARLLDQIVITGVSRATAIRENPVAITGVSAKTIDRTIESTLIDALVKNVPGLTAVKTGPNISKPFIRGLGYNRVLTLYDGIRQEGQQWGDEHGIEVDGYHIEKAEVIKGPASLLFGSDAVAGVVSLFPYLPKEKDGRIHGRVLSEYQTNNGLAGNGLRLGYSNEHWLWILRGSWRLARNYTNALEGRVYNSGFREINAAATFGYTAQGGSSTFNMTLYDNLQGIPDGSRDSLTRRFTKQVYEGSKDSIRDRPLATKQELDGYTLSPLHQHIRHYRVYTNNHYQLGSGELDVLLGFQQNIRQEYNHPGSPLQAGLFVRLNTINYGVRYLIPVLSSLELTAGVNGMHQANKSKAATDFPIPDYHLLDIGTYLYGRWKVEGLTISGGLRYDSRQLRGDDFYIRTDPATGFSSHARLPDTAGAFLQFPSLDKRYSGLSLSIGTAWQLTEKISLKANLGRGYRSPNITEIASNGLDPGAHINYLGNRDFVPEFSLQEDLGLSGYFRDASFSVSLFNNNIRDYIYLSQLVDANGDPQVDAQGNRSFQYQQAGARLYGAEASLSVRPTGWQGLAFDNTLALTYGVNKKQGFARKGTEGEYLPLIPPARWLSSLGQEIPVRSVFLSSIRWKAEMEYNAAQHRYLALYHTETPTRAYTLINFSTGAAFRYAGDRLLQVQFQVTNLFDRVYQNNLSRLKYFEYYAASPDGHTGIYNMGRNICVKLITEF